MARIRSDKPEAYQSETLAEISLAAERTFKGMATIADDRGRLADKPAQINGELWSMRGGHTKEDLEAELCEMVNVDLICRYTGCDGKRYLHMVRWDQHQKIDRPSKSRLPRCPRHQADEDYCGKHEGDCKPIESSMTFDASSRECRELSRESPADSMQDLGSRTVDRGPRTVDQVPPSAGAKTTRRRLPKSEAAERQRHVGEIVAAFVDGATDAGLHAPPASLRSRVGRQAKELLTEDWPIDFLIGCAQRMGASEFSDLAVQVRRDDATAKGRDSPRNGHVPASTGRPVAKQTNYTDEEYASGW